MKLIYIGDPKVIRGVEGWPACDHDEPDEALSAAKLASRLYRSESGKEQRERAAVSAKAKAAANAKEAANNKAEAVGARRAAEQAVQHAEEAEARAEATAPKRGGR